MNKNPEVVPQEPAPIVPPEVTLPDDETSLRPRRDFLAKCLGVVLAPIALPEVAQQVGDVSPDLQAGLRLLGGAGQVALGAAGGLAIGAAVDRRHLNRRSFWGAAKQLMGLGAIAGVVSSCGSGPETPPDPAATSIAATAEAQPPGQGDNFQPDHGRQTREWFNHVRRSIVVAQTTFSGSTEGSVGTAFALAAEGPQPDLPMQVPTILCSAAHFFTLQGKQQPGDITMITFARGASIDTAPEIVTPEQNGIIITKQAAEALKQQGNPESSHDIGVGLLQIDTRTYDIEPLPYVPNYPFKAGEELLLAGFPKGALANNQIQDSTYHTFRAPVENIASTGEVTVTGLTAEGMSGAPAFNAAGKVVGILTANDPTSGKVLITPLADVPQLLRQVPNYA